MTEAKPWTPEEDQTLLNFVQENGTSWKKATLALPHRNGAQARARFYRMHRGEGRATTGLAKHRCSICGRIKSGHICGSDESARAVLAVVRTKRVRKSSYVNLDGESSGPDSALSTPEPRVSESTSNERDHGRMSLESIPPLVLDCSKGWDPIPLAACLPRKVITPRETQVSLLRSFLNYPNDVGSSETESL